MILGQGNDCYRHDVGHQSIYIQQASFSESKGPNQALGVQSPGRRKRSYCMPDNHLQIFGTQSKIGTGASDYTHIPLVSGVCRDFGTNPGRLIIMKTSNARSSDRELGVLWYASTSSPDDMSKRCRQPYSVRKYWILTRKIYIDRP
jgi:hypothetical protein